MHVKRWGDTLKQHVDRTAQQLAEILQRTLDAIEAGDLAASGATLHRLQGALTACSLLAGSTPEEILGAILPDPL